MDKYYARDLTYPYDPSTSPLERHIIKNEDSINFETENTRCKIEDDVQCPKSTDFVTKNPTDYRNTEDVVFLENECIPEGCLSNENVGPKIEIIENNLELGTMQELEDIYRDYSKNMDNTGGELNQGLSKIGKGKELVRKASGPNKKPVQTNTMGSILSVPLKIRGQIETKGERQVPVEKFERLFVRLERIDISDKLHTISGSSKNLKTKNNLKLDQENAKLKLDKLSGQIKDSNLLSRKEYKYAVTKTESLKIEKTLQKWLNKNKPCLESTEGTSEKMSKYGEIYKVSSGGNRTECVLEEVVSKKNRNKYPFTETELTKKSVFSDNMKQHKIDTKKEVKKYQCYHCNKVVLNRKCFLLHMKRSHMKVSRPTTYPQSYQCYHCDKVVKHRKSLINHLKQWHTEGDKKLHCDSCTYKTNLKQALVVHVYRVHVPDSQKPTFICNFCSHQATLKADLRQHIRRVHLGIVTYKKCGQCAWQGEAAHLSLHVRTEHSDEAYICEKCNFTTKTKARLANHQLTHTKVKQFSCPECPYQTHYKGTLKIHLKSHEDNYQKCPECYRMVNETGFKDHLRNHRRPRPKKKCPECGRECTHLSQHLLTHTGGKERKKCPQCSFTALNISYIKQHLKRYHAPLAKRDIFICYHCNKKFLDKNGLIYHLKAVHTINPCECHICGKKLKSKMYLNGHVRKIHNNDRWFECDLCPEGKRYRTKHANNFKWHRVLHKSKDELIMYKCEYCSYDTKVPWNLRKHVAKHHPKKLKKSEGQKFSF